MNIDFKDKTVLVTGATRGIGKQIADDFSALGANLILTGTHQDQIDELNKESKINGNNSQYYCVDFADRRITDKFFQALKEYEKIDVCVNNAGINYLNAIDEVNLEDWDKMMDVNLRGPYFLMHHLSQKMKNNQYGRIVNISSIFGVVSWEKRSMYTTTKAGLLGMTVTAALELAKDNILVNAVSPGFTQTDLTEKNLSKEDQAQLKSQIPLGRFGETKEISRAVMFLASELNTYIVGQNIIVDGGYISA